MTMHEVVHEMVVGECHEPNSEGSGSAWMTYMNARIAGLFLLVLLEYPNGKGVVRSTSRDLIWHYTGRELFTISHSMEARRSNGLIPMVDDSRCTLDRCRLSVRMTMHEDVHEMVVGECHETNSERSGSAWMAYMNARIAGLFLLVLLEYPNGKGVVCATSRDLIWHYTSRELGRSPDESKSQVGPRRIEAESFKLFSQKVLKSVGCAKVVGVISRDIDESI
ncbi:hypothetical protein Tco_0353694 [Tanacetum coccineum]